MHLRIKAHTFYIAHFEPIKFLAPLLGIGVYTNVDTK